MTASFDPLFALSPLDGRYADKLQDLRPICSEYALIRFRLHVELQWFIALCDTPAIAQCSPLKHSEKTFLQSIIDNFDGAAAQQVKILEQRTNHDVKAVEYFLKQQLDNQPTLKKRREFVHFACTSEDINNIAYALMLRQTRDIVLLPALQKLEMSLQRFAQRHARQAMLARTHGQAASPTTLGKEFAVFVYRLQEQRKCLQEAPINAKINGAVGNYNAHLIAYPEVDWPDFSKHFLQQLGLQAQPCTTQIEPHDGLANMAHCVVRLASILIDLARDIWGYIALGYLRQKARDGETGSSTMPHKINPIDFENAEGNLALSQAVLEFLARRLTRSRWQRDLSDSTLLRNLGVGFGHFSLALQSLQRGMERIDADAHTMADDLERHPELLSEAIQTVMRCHGLADPYEKLRQLTRGQAISVAALQRFIAQQDLPQELQQRLLKLSPKDYIGNAAEQALALKNKP